MQQTAGKNPAPGARTVLVTGAGSGLGRALALRYAADGWHVACADILRERAHETRALVQAAGGTALDFHLDITEEASWEALRAQLEQHWPRLDMLVNNAGVASAGAACDVPLEDWRWVLEVNLLGVVRGCRTFVPRMRAQRAGSIVNIASFAGLACAPGMASYTVAKAGVVALSESLRGELGSCGLQVSVVCPSFFRTNLLENFRAPDDDMRRVASRLMDRARHSADDIAASVQAQVARGRFLVIPTRRERWLWRLKCWAPEFYHRRLLRAVGAQRRGARHGAGA